MSQPVSPPKILKRTTATACSQCTGVVRWLVLLSLFTAVACFNRPVAASEYQIDQTAHANYKAAVKALKKKDTATYTRLAKTLEAHPLYPFLEYERLKRRVSSLDSATIDNFSGQYGHAVVASLLEGHYKSVLAKRGKWTEYIRRTEGDRLSVSDRCVRVRALIKTGATIDTVDEEIENLWLSGKSQPDECDPVFKAWRSANRLTTARVFKRIGLAVSRGNTKLAKYLGKQYLGSKDQKWVDRWLAMRANPVRQLNRIKWNATSSPVAGSIISMGMQRALLKDLDGAREKFDRWNTRFALSESDKAAVIRRIGMNAAVDHHPDGSYWLNMLKPDTDTQVTRAWRIRASLREGQFAKAAEYIERLTADEQNEPKWQYWRGRTQALAGNEAEASAIFTRLATERNFYGFLAADRLDLPYEMNHSRFDTSSETIQKTLRREDLVMAIELKALGKVQMARRQWRHATSRMTPDEMRQASIAAHVWQWHDRAIITAGKSGHTNDLDVRFPVLYENEVVRNAKRHKIPEHWVYGVMRQESAFMTDARSGVGALGLMQLMPGTGRKVAKQLKLKGVKSRASIMKPKTNIKLGTAYLRSVLDRMGGHLVLATASYNAGPHKVERWLPVDSSIEADVWIETIPYKETRNFVKNVLSFMAVYGYRLDGKPDSIQGRLRAVTPNSS